MRSIEMEPIYNVYLPTQSNLPLPLPFRNLPRPLPFRNLLQYSHQTGVHQSLSVTTSRYPSTWSNATLACSCKSKMFCCCDCNFDSNSSACSISPPAGRTLKVSQHPGMSTYTLESEDCALQGWMDACDCCIRGGGGSNSLSIRQNHPKAMKIKQSTQTHPFACSTSLSSLQSGCSPST